MTGTHFLSLRRHVLTVRSARTDRTRDALYNLHATRDAFWVGPLTTLMRKYHTLTGTCLNAANVAAEPAVHALGEMEHELR